MSLELRASILATRNQVSESKSLFQKAAQEEKALGYHEPPTYIRPVGEAEGGAMVAIGNWADAKDAYVQALLERPKSGFALYGLARCNEKAGSSEVAAKQYAEFLSAWSHADPALPQVMHAKTYLREQWDVSGRQQ